MRIVVALDGSGDYTSIQDAINALPERADEVREIFVRKGQYRGRVVINKPRVRLVGEGRSDVEIVHTAYAKQLNPDGRERATFLSFALLTAAPEITVENLTIRNDAGDGRVVGQAPAVYAAGDRGVWRDCTMIACQDTLFCGPLMQKVLDDVAPLACEAECVPFVGDCPPTYSRQYFENCRIEGDVDFIFGPYRCWFEKCVLSMNARGGWYTAANTPEAQPWGMVFHACRLTGECVPGMGYLGRPWRAYARTLFMDCEMDEHVSPLGFMDWDENKVVTDRLGEWHTVGARADQSTRHPMQKRLTADEARGITPTLVLSGWDPVGGEGALQARLRNLRCGRSYRYFLLPAQLAGAGDMGVDAFLSRYLREYQPYKRYWNYEDGCVLKGCIDLYRATGEPAFRDFVLAYLDRVVRPDGSIPGFPLDSYNIDSINCGKALFFALDETGDQRYRIAADFHAARLEKHPRCACGNFWHKEIYPDQIWLDGLYMAQPFRAEYMLRFGDPLDLRDIAAQFQNVRRYLYNGEKGLYYHACDMAKKQPWANPETGTSPNFWLRSMGWYLMALIDCQVLVNRWLMERQAECIRRDGLWKLNDAGDGAERLEAGAVAEGRPVTAFSLPEDEALGERMDVAEECRDALEELFIEAAKGILRWRDDRTGLYWQVIDRADVEGNYLETSGSAMVIYALMVGHDLLRKCDELKSIGLDGDFESLTLRKLRCDPCELKRRMYEVYRERYGVEPGDEPDDGTAEYMALIAVIEKSLRRQGECQFKPDGTEVWRLRDICKVAGLGPGEKRDGSVEYYLSEPRVADDAKGVGPWMMALAQYIRRLKRGEDEERELADMADMEEEEFLDGLALSEGGADALTD